MEQKTVTIPFDLETAKRINIGGIVGRIVTEKGRNRAEIVYEDNSSSCPLLVVIHSITVSADWFSATGKALSSENRLLLEVPEYITFKDGEVLSNEDGSFIFILNIHGKYLTSFYASLAAGVGLNISDNFSACNNEIERYRLATDSEKQRMIKALKKSKNPKAKEYLKRFFGIEERTKYEFKPFDKVLAKYYEDDNNVNAAQSLSALIMVLRIACFGKHLKNWIWMLVMPHGFTSPAAATTASTIGE